MSETMTNEAVAENKADDLAGKFLTFNIGKTIYGVQLLDVKEIIQIESITRVPFLPPHIKGIINLRSSVVPVIDVRLKLHVEEKAYDDKTCIIIIEIYGERVGMIVDQVAEVVVLESSEMSAPPSASAQAHNDYLQSVAEIDDKIILLLDCNKFFQAEMEK